MSQILLSEAEKIFILHGIQKDHRIDGRCSLAYRPIEIETNVVSSANGSAKIKIANTDVLVAIKAELKVPLLHKKDEGYLEIFVDCSANATPEFEGRGGELLSVDLSQTLASLFNNNSALNKKQLCILSGGEKILQCGGNLYDAASFGVKAALFNTQLPNVTLNSVDAGIPIIELSDDPFDCWKLDIGNGYIVDPNLEEEACSQGMLVIGFDNRGKVSTIRKWGPGSFIPDTITQILKLGSELAKEVHQKLLQSLYQEENLENNNLTTFSK